MKAAAAWRIVGILGLSIGLVGFGYAIYLSTQVRLVPYIVEVDKLGTAVAAGFPQHIEYADARVVRASLGSFITAFRSITPDAIVQKQYIDRTYALLRGSDPSTEKINAWFRGNSPFEKAKSSTVAVEVNNIVALSNQTYQIDWTEYERDRTGKEIATRRFRGIATVTLNPPQDEATIRLNPIGLYIRDFDWTEQL
ncbi:type IV secretion system protein VirB5 [Rhizobium sp. BK313]|nr:type IV secretion system protein VirB5 [Rhizobium sp. BK313]